MITLIGLMSLVLMLVLWAGNSFSFWISAQFAAVFALILLVTEGFGGWVLHRLFGCPLKNAWRIDVRAQLRALRRFVVFLVVFAVVKAPWTAYFAPSGEKLLRNEEREEILERRRWLLDVAASPSFALSDMPFFMERVFQQEWAIGTLSMTATALTNIAYEFPETRAESLAAIKTMIERMLQSDIREFEVTWWNEDALESLAGNHGHAGYLGHLNFMLGAWKKLGGDESFRKLHDDVSAALARRILASPHRYLETFPDLIFIPDNAVIAASLALYNRVYRETHHGAVSAWLDHTKSQLIDPATGLIQPWIGRDGRGFGPARGSYASWTLFYLSFADPDFSKEQFVLLKRHFAVELPFGLAGIREYRHGTFGPADIDSGPVIFGLSTSGTGFAVSGARLFGDAALVQGLLRTAETAGSTVRWNGRRHYLVAPVVGEAIMLAMKTATPWECAAVPKRQ